MSGRATNRILDTMRSKRQIRRISPLHRRRRKIRRSLDKGERRVLGRGRFIQDSRAGHLGHGRILCQTCLFAVGDRVRVYSGYDSRWRCRRRSNTESFP